MFTNAIFQIDLYLANILIIFIDFLLWLMFIGRKRYFPLKMYCSDNNNNKIEKRDILDLTLETLQFQSNNN